MIIKFSPQEYVAIKWTLGFYYSGFQPNVKYFLYASDQWSVRQPDYIESTHQVKINQDTLCVGGWVINNAFMARRQSYIQDIITKELEKNVRRSKEIN